MSETNTLHDLEGFVRNVFGFLGGAMISATIHLGDRLGLYRAMADAGPVTVAGLAAKTGLNERWLAEWLHAQAAASLVEYHGPDGFELTPVGKLVLADEESSLAFSAGAFEALPSQLGVLEKLTESFRTGIGLPYDAFGPSGAHGIERMFAPWFKALLVPVILPGLDGVVAKLEAGAHVADVGCGGGVALVTMAKAFPKSRFEGWDISRHALERAAQNVKDAGVTNVTVHDVSAVSLPTDAPFDLITAFDCIHDMTDPQGALSAINKALRSDGTLLIADIKSYPTYEQNVENNPMAAMMYATSLVSCMSSATSEPGGAGLGTLGFHQELAREMTERAGFTRLEVHDFGHPVNWYYEVRP